MKLGTPIYILLAIAFVFTCVGLIVSEMRTNYPEAGVPETSYDKYNYANQMNSSVTAIRDASKKIGGIEGWWSQIIGAVASSVIIFLGLIIAIGQIILSIPFFGSILYEVGNVLSIPPAVTSITFIAIMASIVIMIVKFVHKGQS